MVAVMDQVSPPMRIALVAVLVLAGLWFTVLRPKSADSTPAPTAAVQAPGVAGLGRAVKAAHDTAAGRPVDDPVPPASAPHASQPAPSTAPAPSGAVGTLSSSAGSAAATDRRATILLFSGSGADDAVARQSVRSLRGPHVRTIVAPIADVTRYRRLIGDIEIKATPTILVISPQHTAREIVGLPDPLEIQQLLAAALRP
jgi:hypothetical protein